MCPVDFRHAMVDKVTIDNVVKSCPDGLGNMQKKLPDYLIEYNFRTPKLLGNTRCVNQLLLAYYKHVIPVKKPPNTCRLC